jgi:AcrR family transcriptional regulator
MPGTAIDPPTQGDIARRPHDAEQTRRDILDAATIEFSENGLSGTRVDAIAARMKMSVRMIYYYFGSKDGLYRAVLEQAYEDIRRAEAALNLQGLEPAEAVRRMVEFVFDYQESHSAFNRLVTTENIHRAVHIAHSDTIQTLNSSVIDTIEAILRRGQGQGLFRQDATALGVHLLMTAFCFFRVSNRYTLNAIFGRDPLSPDLRAEHRTMIVDSVLGYLQRRA